MQRLVKRQKMQNFRIYFKFNKTWNYTLSSQKKCLKHSTSSLRSQSSQESQAQWGLRHLVIKEKVDKWNMSMPTSLSDNTMSNWIWYPFLGTEVTTLKSTIRVNRQSIIYQLNEDDQQIRQVSKTVDYKDLKRQIKQKYSTESAKRKKNLPCPSPVTHHQAT